MNNFGNYEYNIKKDTSFTVYNSVVIYGLLFIISQMVNMKYYFDHSLPTPIYSSENTIPICKKEFFQELILFAKIIVGYAICGLVLSIFVIRRK